MTENQQHQQNSEYKAVRNNGKCRIYKKDKKEKTRHLQDIGHKSNHTQELA